MSAPVGIRLLTVLSAAALGAVVAPVAAAATPSPYGGHCGAGPTGSASADLVALTALGALPLGLPLAGGAGLRIASARSGVAATRATASARGIDATLANLPLRYPAPVAAQQAPPAHASTQVRSTAVDLGVARVGTGDLRAQASCPTATASASMLDATVLPGMDGLSLLKVPGNVNAGTSVGTSVVARVGLADIRLFDGTQGRVAVKVLTEPTLTVTPGTHPDVRYSSPVLEVTLPGGQVHRLNAPGQHIDLGVARTGAVSVSGPQRAITENLPGNPLAALSGHLPPGTDLVVLRLSVGALTRHGSGTSASASASTLRVQLIESGSTLLDLGVGVLSADASGTPLREVTGAGSGGGTLPLTGVNVGWLVGTGLLAAIAGRFLLVISRRRTSAEPE
jgi:hypothetical protein